jgi:hypothetical protein
MTISVASPDESDAAIEERLHEIECSLARYGCFDLVEEDVEWLIARLRAELDHRVPQASMRR